MPLSAFNRAPLIPYFAAIPFSVSPRRTTCTPRLASDALAPPPYFSIDGSGKLITRDGMTVLGSGGAITIDPNAGDVSISKDGAVQQNGQILGKLDVAAFDKPGALEKMGGNLWKPVGQASRAPVGARIAGGFVEGSNVNAVSELTEMIAISRTYESVGQMLSNADQMRGGAIDKLSRIS